MYHPPLSFETMTYTLAKRV